MVSKIVMEKRIAHRAALAARRKLYMTIQEVATYLGCQYGWAYDLIVRQGEIPYILHGSGGQSNPKYLVLRKEAHKYKSRKKPKGRPRLSDSPMRGKRRNRTPPLLTMAAAIQEYRKVHGHYPSLDDLGDVKPKEESPGQYKKTMQEF